jgi:hypothetical protein
MTQPRSRMQWTVCFAVGGALLGLSTTLERVLHHGHAYAVASAMLLHASVAVLAASGLGALLGGALDGLDASAGRSPKARVRLACGVAASVGAVAYWAVVRVSKYGQALPPALGMALCAVGAAVAAYAGTRLVPVLLRRRAILRWLMLAGVVLIAWIDLHAYVRSYGNVHLFLSTLALLGAGATVALFAPSAVQLTRVLALTLPLSLAIAFIVPASHSAKHAVLQLGALEKLLIQHVLWRALDGDGDGAARAALGADCDDQNAAVAPLRLPVRARSLDCAPIRAKEAPAPALAPALQPKRDLVWIVVDTWRTDTPSVLPSWAQPLTRLTGYRSCGSRTEQVLSQLLGAEGCPKAIAGNSLAGLLANAGYELVHMGEYPDATGRFPASQQSPSRAALVQRARSFFKGRRSSRPLFAIVHFKGGHAPYDGEGKTSRARYDHAIGRTLAAVGELLPDLPEQAVVVVAGDHGEEFGEHDADTHALSLYEEVLRTPVLVRAPQLAAGADDRAIECAGLAEMVAALVSDAPVKTVPAPRSFALVAAPKGVHGGLSETISYASVRNDGLKIVWQPRLDIFELYDLRRDPRERNNLADTRTEELRAMAAMLIERVQACAGDHRLGD